MNAALPRFASLLLSTILFAGLSAAVCPGSLPQTSLAGYALSPDASRIAAIADDGTLFWWDAATGKRTQLLECVNPRIFDHPILFGPDSARLAVAVSGGIDVFDVPTGRVIAQLRSTKLKEVRAVVFSADGKRLAVSHEAGVIVWRIEGQTEMISIPDTKNSRALALNHDGSVVAVDGCNGLVLRTVDSAKVERTVQLEGAGKPETLVFSYDDRWVVAATVTALRNENPQGQAYTYKREIGVWDAATGNRLKSLQGEIEELRFPIATGAHDTLLATDYKDHLRVWNLNTGELKATWETSSGHPSADGKFLLREGGLGRLELWRIGAPDETARSFVYRSPLCDTVVSQRGDKETKFQPLFIADGYNEDEAPFGSSSTLGYVAQDCSRLNFSHLVFKSPERAKDYLARHAAEAVEILETGPPKDFGPQVFLGERIVARFARKAYSLGPFSVMWVDGNSVSEIHSSSLPLALEMEREYLQGLRK
jgi:WD40 repeat protein